MMFQPLSCCSDSVLSYFCVEIIYFYIPMVIKLLNNLANTLGGLIEVLYRKNRFN